MPCFSHPENFDLEELYPHIITILETGSKEYEAFTVRWCEKCGAVMIIWRKQTYSQWRVPKGEGQI